jgi:hypothetical protein
MNLRVYFRLLQPARTMPFVAFFTAATLLFGHVFFKLVWPRETLFVTCAVTLPLLVGAALTGMLHAVLHRPYALLLPDLLGKVRRAAALTYLALAALATLACGLIEPAAPAPAAFGLALGLLTLSCANRRLGFPRLKFLGLLPGSLTVMLAWLFFHLKFAHDLLPAMQTAPWAFLVGGAGLAATTFALGFSRRTLRERATTPYFATAYTWASVVDKSTLRRQLREQTQFNASRGLGQKPANRNWPLRTVGPRLRDWLRVLDHQRAVSPARMRVMIFAVMLAMIAGMIGGFATLGDFTGNHPFGSAVFLATLADLTAPIPTGTSDFSGSILIAVLVFSLSPPMSTSFSRPLLAYPLARRRLAEVVCAHTCRQFFSELLLPLLAFWVASLLGQFASGKIHPGLGLPAIAVIVLVYAPFQPLLALNYFVRGSPGKNFAISGGAFFLGIGTVALVLLARMHWSAAILSPVGIAASLLATAAALALLRHRIQRHYRTCDLTDEAARGTSFGAPNTAGN